MPHDRYFSYKKSQIENFVKNEFKKKFRSTAKISIRKRQKFIAEMIIKHSLVFPALIGEIQILFRKILMHF